MGSCSMDSELTTRNVRKLLESMEECHDVFPDCWTKLTTMASVEQLRDWFKIAYVCDYCFAEYILTRRRKWHTLVYERSPYTFSLYFKARELPDDPAEIEGMSTDAPW